MTRKSYVLYQTVTLTWLNTANHPVFKCLSIGTKETRHFSFGKQIGEGYRPMPYGIAPLPMTAVSDLYAFSNATSFVYN